ncbi:bifunctional 3-demethylubiquinone-9 3-methyltransferase/ 2-octaprenyl-6-hydroxy phenol methylase [Legionella busanensis]|uniref:Bifunctional 3-demethylubiquinone-9 3-methyltransferase/ 2-octaprenyl-6-hydroxy phenol methylase n=1 Tax=Legionella busanensis TaxID=190655 RepID=A0A378JML9_9GAMM|nr:class I SAM-dependent methyltransferase [Legionella busanensis]STX51449.1 bifunctional 3-demethylubiquinone-9 3-methyltransferase/ 2-octaprenyl-6-hydroxy phenol methylase [Legionella busanensis]
MSKYNTTLEHNYFSSQSKILSKISPNSMVLEFGSAHGVMTKYMREQLNCKVFAVELDAQAANDAKQYCERILVSNIEDYQWKIEFDNLKFDYIIFADVLEHLYNPWRALAEVRSFLKDEGRILLSIPNIANNVVIMNLINDKFEYQSTGLLDDTHIRFFTKNSIDKMIKAAGYKAVDIDAIFLAPPDTEFHRSYLEFNQGVVNTLIRKPNGHVYQYIYEIVDANSSLSEYQIDKLKEPLRMEIFYDTGKDFNQEESLPILSYGKHTVTLPKVEIKRLRIDPSSHPGCLKKPIVKVADANGIIYECAFTLIGFNYLSEQQAICFGTDPQIIVDLPITNPVKLIFDLDYKVICFSKDIFSAHETLNNLSNVQGFQVEDINTLQTELANRKQELERIKTELEHAKKELQLIKAEIPNDAI